MSSSNNKLFDINKTKQTKIVNIKDLFSEDSERADYVLRELLKTLGFAKPTESLIQCTTLQGQLVILSLCPDISFKVPSHFMYDEPGFGIGIPTLYTLKENILSVQKKLLVPHSPDVHIKNIVEIPIKLDIFELQKGMMFGQYKMYHNMFVTDKIVGNKHIPDELENLLLKSMLRIDQDVNLDINRSSLNEYRKKIKKTWAKMEKHAIVEKYQILKSCSLSDQLASLIPDSFKQNKKVA